MHSLTSGARRIWTSTGRWEGLAVFLILLLGLLVRLPNLDHPLTEDSAFRQAETAYPALLFHLHGINLFAPQLPVFGAPWQAPFEFPLFQGTAALIMDVGISPDLALRMTSLACFVATALLLWGLVRHLSTRTAAAIALFVFIAWPYGLYWSRTSMIEYLVTALTLGYVWAGMVWIDKGRKLFAVIAVVLGSLAIMVKLTSAVFWLVPLLLYWGCRRRPPTWRRLLSDRLRVSVVLCLVPLLAGALWTLHADSIKARSPATAWLTSGALKTFTLGTVHERLSLGNWRTVMQPLTAHITGLPLWQLALLVLVALGRERRAVWLGIVLAGMLPVIVFFNLYLVQDYYLIAITPAVAAVIGYSVEGLLSRLPALPRRSIAVALIGAWCASTLYYDREYLGAIYGATDPYQILPAAAEVQAGTRPSDLIVFEGLDWSPSVPYYARRVGMMLPLQHFVPQVLDALPAQGYTYLFAVAPQPNTFSLRALAVLHRWAWFGAVSPHLFHLGQSYSSVAAATVAGSQETFTSSDGSASGLAAPTILRCGGPITTIAVAPGATTTLTFSDSGMTSGVSLQVDGHSIPASRTVVVASAGTPAGAVDLACSGGTSLVITHVFAVGPGPRVATPVSPP